VGRALAAAPYEARRSLRNGYVVEDATDDDLGCDLLRLSLVGDDEPVAHDIEGDRLDVIRQNVVATVEERVRARCERDVDRRPRRDTVRDERLQIGELRPLRIAGREDHTDHVVLDRVVHVHLADGRASIEDGRGGGELSRDRGLLDRASGDG